MRHVVVIPALVKNLTVIFALSVILFLALVMIIYEQIQTRLQTSKKCTKV